MRVAPAWGLAQARGHDEIAAQQHETAAAQALLYLCLNNGHSGLLSASPNTMWALLAGALARAQLCIPGAASAGSHDAVRHVCAVSQAPRAGEGRVAHVLVILCVATHYELHTCLVDAHLACKWFVGSSGH